MKSVFFLCCASRPRLRFAWVSGVGIVCCRDLRSKPDRREFVSKSVIVTSSTTCPNSLPQTGPVVINCLVTDGITRQIPSRVSKKSVFLNGLQEIQRKRIHF